MKAGTLVQLSDGRIGTAVFNGLVGVEIKWGRHKIPEGGIGGQADMATIGVCCDSPPEDFNLFPDVLLCSPVGDIVQGLKCVGDNWEIIE